MADADYTEVEPGLGLKLRAIDANGDYVEWTITVENARGGIKVIADTACVEGKRRSAIIVMYPASHNSVVLRNGR